MKRYRIESDYGCYNGCIPITAYWVQVHVKLPFLGWTWVGVKGFDTQSKAEELLNYLETGKNEMDIRTR